MINNLINTLVRKYKKYGIDGYIIPKNDEFFSEYSANDRLKTISNFSGSAGYQSFLKRKTIYLLMGDTLSKQKKRRVKTLKL